MINNSFSFTGVVVGLYSDKRFENNLQVFEIEIEKQDYNTVILPIITGKSSDSPTRFR